MPQIQSSSYGESRLRLLRVVRRGDRDDPRDLTISLRFEGDFGDAFRDGRSDDLVPGEAVKNLVHRVARETADGQLETLGLAICARVYSQGARVGRLRVEIAEQPWLRVEIGGKAQGQAFTPAGPERRTTAVTSNGERVAVVSGLENLVVLRTGGLAPPRREADADQGLSDRLQRVLVASIDARWSYTTGDIPFLPYRQGIRTAIVETFARHASVSVQHTLYDIGDVLLASFPEIADVTLAVQEHPYRPADLFREGVENPDDLFVVRDEPLGVVEVTVARE